MHRRGFVTLVHFLVFLTFWVAIHGNLIYPPSNWLPFLDVIFMVISLKRKLVQKVSGVWVHHQVQVVIDVASLAHVKLGPFCPIAKNQDPISRSIEGSLLVFLWRKVGSTIFASSQKSRYLLANMTRRPKKVGRKLLFKAHFFIKSQ